MSELRVLAASMPSCHGVVKSRTGCGIRVKCADYSTVRSRLYPDWVPQKDTPYDTSLSLKYELHHVHPGAGKGDLQALINSLNWRALVVRQTRPKQWLVASDSPPPRDSFLTEHGTILVLQSKLAVEKGMPKGKGKGYKGKGPSWLMGVHPNARYQEPASVPAPQHAMSSTTGDIHGPIKKAAVELEQKMEERLATMRQENATCHSLMKQDLQNMRQEFADQLEQQRQDTKSISDRVQSVESNLTGQLSAFMATLNNTIAQQGAELSSRLQSGQEALRTELSNELRQHVGARKRTPPPPAEREAGEGDKRMRE